MSQESQIPSAGRSMLALEEKPWPFRIVLAVTLLLYLVLMPARHAMPAPPDGFGDSFEMPWGAILLVISIGYFCLVTAILVWDLFLNTAKLVRHGRVFWDAYWGLFVFDIVCLLLLALNLSGKFGPAPVVDS